MEEFQAFGAVVFVLALLGAVLFLLRRKGVASFQIAARRAGLPRRMEAVEKVSLGPQQSLHLVRVGDASYLVAMGPGACQITPVSETKQI